MDTVPLTLQISLDPTVQHPVPDAVSFRTGPAIPGALAYEDLDPFWRDLIAGRPMPLQLVARRVDDERTVLAMALFLHRDLAVNPKMLNVLAASALWRDFPMWGLSHVDRDLGGFLGLLRVAVPPSGLDRRTLGERLSAAIGWVCTYVREDVLPPLRAMPMPTVLDVGTDGFVVASTTGSLMDGWVDLSRMGHLRGVLIQELPDGRRSVLAARKSYWVQLNLEAAAEVLNAMEAAMNRPRIWHVFGNLLEGQVTEILVKDLVRVLIRV